MSKADNVRTITSFRPLARFVGVSIRDLLVTGGPLVIITIIAICAAFWYMRPAPPNSITISSGPPGSMFRLNAEKYKKILAHNGVKLNILASEGSLENLKRLTDPAMHVDVAFVQGGLSDGKKIDNLASLGSVFHEPLFVFYRNPSPISLLSELQGKRLAIGPEGSGTRALVKTLLKSNDIEPGGATSLLALGGENAAKALVDNKVDAVFLMGDSAAPQVIRSLLLNQDIRLLNVAQAEAYVRRLPYLSKLNLPMGAFDFGKNVPSQDVTLIGPTVELVARDNLHPALSDMLIEAAKEVHGGAKLLQHAGEFPAPLEHEYRISDDARRYYTSGKTFLYRNLPFWLATLVDRLLVVVVPVIVLLIPGLKLVPTLYDWRIKSRIYRFYGKLIGLERDILLQPATEEKKELLKQLDEIEAEVNKMKIPLAYAEQFYVLRDHINFVRARNAS
jgi:TRAP transporter TAXI family solute receptor